MDAAVAGGDRAHPRLERAHRHLVAPVEPLLVIGPRALAGLDEADLATGVADLRIGERLSEPRERIALERDVGVGEDEQFAARCRHAGVERGDLAAAIEVEHHVGPGFARAGGRGVAASVGADDQLEAIARPVERQRVCHLGGDHRLLVVRRDDQRDARRACDAGRLRGVWRQSRQDEQHERIAELCVDEQAGTGPEDHLDGGHAAILPHRRGAGRQLAGLSQPKLRD